MFTLSAGQLGALDKLISTGITPTGLEREQLTEDGLLNAEIDKPTDAGIEIWLQFKRSGLVVLNGDVVPVEELYRAFANWMSASGPLSDLKVIE
jgi:hypothetical protein